MLSPNQKIAELAERYRPKQRLQIRDVLLPEAAERIHLCLTRETPWSLVYNEGETVIRVSPEELQTMPAEEKARRLAAINARARSQFQFLYNSYLMLENYLAKKDPGLLLHRVLEEINSPPFLDFVRGVTGIKSVFKADAQATLYAPGHFLNFHNDSPDKKINRRIAYVLSFTRNWNPDWGGLLQFYDAERNITDTFVPRFNALSLFTVPQDHAVTYVPSYAAMGRFSITGWFNDP